MFERLRASWQLIKASWAVLQSDKELLVFPIISGIGAIIISILFAVPFLTVGIVQGTRGEEPGITVLGYVIAFLFYVVLYSVTFFCNTALVGAALIRLRGGDPTVSDGFRIARERLGAIIGYAAISATVGVVLNALSERAGLLGRIVIGIIGFVWNVATFLVVPVLVIENLGPWEAVKRSASLLKRTWGENIVGNFGIGAVASIIAFLIIIGGLGLLFLGISIDSVPLAIGGMVAMIALLILLGLVISALQGIYQAAVYQYAATGETSGFFAPELVQQAFKPKRG